MISINPALISMLLRSKLDELLSGKPVDGFKVKEQTAERVVLVPADLSAFDGITVKTVNVAIQYKGVEIILSHE